MDRIELAEMAKTDYYRLKYHVMPEGGWMNDPNGLIRYKGNYHVFYQHYPYGTEWGPMHWGHVISRDLVHWEYLPFALVPDQSYETGCFSGSAVDNGGELALIYTADHPGRSPRESQCAAFSGDGVRFTKYENNPVIPGPPPGFGEDFRDPKVFRRGDLWYLAAGCTRKGEGGVLLYASKDLRRWDCRGLVCKSDGTQGEMWECPDLFPLGETWVLMTSPIGMEGVKTIFITGDMDFDKADGGLEGTPGKAAFSQRAWRKVDYGTNFYAPQTFEDGRGRRILIGWMNTWGAEIPTTKKGWNGALTFPRELFLRDGEVWQRPVGEIGLLRKRELRRGGLSLRAGAEDRLEGLRGDSVEIGFGIPAGAGRSGKFSLCLRASEDGREKAVLGYDFSTRVFSVDTGNSPPVRLPPAEGEGEIPVHILIDTSSLEIFLCGGKYVFSSRIFPRPGSVFYRALAEGLDLTLPGFRAWELG